MHGSTRDVNWIRHIHSMTATLEENKLRRGNCISVCTDGVPAMTGRIKGFISRLKKDFPNVGSTHCFFASS
jgi:hypothetical protein